MPQIILRILLTVVVWGIAGILTTKIWKSDINLVKYVEENIKLPIYKRPIIITPDKISLRTKDWKEISTFSVYNSSDEILYNVYVKIQIETPQIPVQAIEVFPQNETDYVVVPIKDISVTYDVVFLNGTDSKGKESIYLLLYSLGSKESKAFKINTVPSFSSNVEQVKVLIKVSKYSEKPARILEDPSKGTFIQFSLPENFQMKSVKQRLKRNK